MSNLWEIIFLKVFTNEFVSFICIKIIAIVYDITYYLIIEFTFMFPSIYF